MPKETLRISETVDFNGLLNCISYGEDNAIIDDNSVGTWREQVVPSVYFRQNDFFRAEFNSATFGMHLKIISTQKNMSFSLEFVDSIFLEHYKIKESTFSLLKCINREKLTTFEEIGTVNFMAVKAKKSYEFMRNMRGARVGGLITGMLFRGAVKLAARTEDELVEKEGCQFALGFIENGTEIKFDVIVDSFYVNTFREFLKVNWTSNVPDKPKVEKQVDNGFCFIATACYNDYDHPIVFQLRKFRDDFLQERTWGRKFVRFYYTYSPVLANAIAKNKFFKIIAKYVVVKPLYFLSRLFV